MASAKWTARLGGARPSRVVPLAIVILLVGVVAIGLWSALRPESTRFRTVSKEYAGSTVSGSATLAVRLFVELPYDAPPSARLVLGDATVTLTSVTFDEPGCSMTATGAGQEDNRIVVYRLEGHPTEGHFDGTLHRDNGATSVALFLPRVGRAATGC